MAKYFSDDELGPRARNIEEISDPVWRALWVLVDNAIEDGSLGLSFPDPCPDEDRHAIVGTHRPSFLMALLGEVPALAKSNPGGRGADLHPDRNPGTLAAIDTVQFVHARIAKPERTRFHPFHDHYDLDFDREVGRDEFRKAVNRIFARNGVGYTLLKTGGVRRTLPKHMREMARVEYDTDDQELNELLASAVRGILDPRPAARRRGLEQLWDAWERLKTYRGKKKESISHILRDAAAGNEELFKRLDAEAQALTRIGNDFRIRHHERDRVKVEEADQVDYLFWRMLALVRFLIPHLRADD